jgi:GDSL-like Lipase/Acylhydrolase family
MRKLADRRGKTSLRVWRRRLLLILLGVTFGLALVEIGLRLVGFSYPEFYVTDARRGYSLRPNMEGWYRKEGEAYVRINSEGLRDREHSKIKPPNTFRIAVLGDSFVEALQVHFEESFCHIIEQQLRNCPAMVGRDVEVVNFGVSGYGTAQELITLRNQVWQYSPDLVLLTVTTNNDISDNSPALKKTNQIPYFVWRDERLVEDDSFQETRSFQSRNNFLGRAARWFRDHLRLVQAIQQASFAIRVMREQRAAAKSSQPEKAANAPQNSVMPADELGVDNLVYREPSDPIWINAWTVTEQLIKTMRSEVESKGAVFAVMTLSNPPQVLPAPASREAFLRRVGAQDIFYPDNRIAQFCRREGIAVTTLAPAMQEYAEQNNVMLHGFGKDIGNGHWNVAGHHLAGQLAAYEICKLLANRKSQ